MDKGLRFQVDVASLGKKVISKILRGFEKLSKQEQVEYQMSNETVIMISDFQIWAYGIIEDISGREIKHLSSFDNSFGSRKVVKIALENYFVNSEYTILEIIEEESGSPEEGIRTKMRIFPAILP